MKILYWSDYSCPYCYIGEERLKKALSSLGKDKDIEIEMKAFQLDPTCADHPTEDTQTRFARKYGISMEQAAHTIEHISQLGRAEGLDFKYATTLFTNTMDAHRLTKLAQTKGDHLAQKVIERLFRAYFTENRELSDKELLQQIGEECGLDADEVSSLLKSDQFRDEVRMDEQEAAGNGIHAVPFFIIGKYAISGAQSVEGMKRALEDALREEDLREGMQCGPEGCRIGL